MSLNTAHEGYEYQDLLCVFFIFKEILAGFDSVFSIDQKEYDSDKFDDLTINRNGLLFKKQIKYSNQISSHTFEKKDISATSNYSLELDGLFDSWKNHPNKDNCEVRLCLAWDSPSEEELTEVLTKAEVESSFIGHPTNSYKLNSNKLWPEGSDPKENWRRFRTQSKNMDRAAFVGFCENHLIIETDFPKFSLDLQSPESLEKIVINQARDIGVGQHPNMHITPVEFVRIALMLVKKHRSIGLPLTKKLLFQDAMIIEDYGAIDQVFPIQDYQYVERTIVANEIIDEVLSSKKLYLHGEPGSGKSWLIEAIKRNLETRDIFCVKHYCYTELNDKLQSRRILKNTLYGNLIKAILDIEPDLRSEKLTPLASNLEELNHLIPKVKSNIVIIIDGLDHISRVVECLKIKDQAMQDRDIISVLNSIKTSENVSILVIAQPLQEVQKLVDFKQCIVPRWDIRETKELMAKYNISDFKVETEMLSEQLKIKSDGNPLYLTYILKSIYYNKNISIKDLPAYSYNLTEYYEFIISTDEEIIHHDVPRILAGAVFYVSEMDLKEITGLGNQVTRSLQRLSPIVKQNQSLDGYSVYHESFKRFILDKIKYDGADVNVLIYDKIVTWLASKDFFAFPKSFRNLFFYLHLTNRFDFIKITVDSNFISKCLKHGYTWKLIAHNLRYLLKVAIESRDLPTLIRCIELDKIVVSKSDVNDFSTENLFNAIGYLYGFEKVRDLLAFEGEPTYDPAIGIIGCYLCALNNVVAPWDLYSSYFEKLTLDNVNYWVRYQILNNHHQQVQKIIERNKGRVELITKIHKELAESNFTKSDDDKKLIEFAAIHLTTVEWDTSESDLLIVINKLINLDHIHDTEHILFNQLVYYSRETTNIKPAVDILSNIVEQSWFINWLKYTIIIYSYKSEKTVDQTGMLNTFRLLSIDTEPFKGKIRACDLYSIKDFIHQTIKDGLSLVVKNNLKDVFQLLFKCSIETQTYLDKSMGGPLTTDVFVDLCYKYLDTDVEYFVELVENSIINEQKSDHYYSYIADYYLTLSIYLSKNGLRDKADSALDSAIQCILAYGFHKDMTFDDCLNAIEGVSIFDPSNLHEALRVTKSLAYSVVAHTDGRSTKHYPVEWYERFLHVDFNGAISYLLSALIKVPYDWRLENSLKEALSIANGEKHPLVELALLLSFVLSDSEILWDSVLKRYEEIIHLKSEYAAFLSSIIQSRLPKKASGSVFSKEFMSKVQYLFPTFSFESKDKNSTHTLNPERELQEKVTLSGEQLLKMDSSHIVDHFKERNDRSFGDQKLEDEEIEGLYYYFKNVKFTPDVKAVIISIVELQYKYNNARATAFEKCIEELPDEFYTYFMTARFIYETGGWGSKFVNTKALRLALNRNAELTKTFFFELLEYRYSGDKIHHWGGSGNLISVLAKTDIVSVATLKNMWDGLLDITKYRLPYTNIIDLSIVDHGMSVVERLVCILLSRLIISTQDRSSTTLALLRILLREDFDLCIKPLKWFITKVFEDNMFDEHMLLLVLQLLIEEDCHHEFKTELSRIYPTRYFAIDSFIQQVFNLSPSPQILLSHSCIDDQKSTALFELFYQKNIRVVNILDKFNYLDLSNCILSDCSKMVEENKEIIKFHHNRMYNKFVPNLFLSKVFMDTINKSYYAELFNTGAKAQHIIIDLKMLLLQLSSIVPYNEIVPFDLLEADSKNSGIPPIHNNWVRIASITENSEENDRWKINKCVKWCGLIQKSNFDILECGPLSFLRAPSLLFNVGKSLEPPICNSFFQMDQFEDYRLLWLPNTIVDQLLIEVVDSLYGLHGKNKEGDIVLKYRYWKTDYLGTDIDDEIAKKCGADLIIRKDYFEKLQNMFSNNVKYVVLDL